MASRSTWQWETSLVAKRDENRHRILLTLLSLLALATSASAECAWVLWEEEERTDANNRSQTSWRINSAAPGGTRPGQRVSGDEFCEAMRGSMAQVVANNSQPGPTNPNVKEVQTAPGVVIVIFKGERERVRRSNTHSLPVSPRHRGPAWAEGEVMPLNLGAWWSEPEYKVCGTFKARGYFVLSKLHELDPARFLTATANLYHRQEKEPQGITKLEWKAILEHMGASPEEIKDVQVKMGKWQ